jgi:hypothetical protein
VSRSGSSRRFMSLPIHVWLLVDVVTVYAS